MGKLVAVEGAKLSEMQQRFVENVLAGMENKAAAKAAGYSDITLHNDPGRSSAVKAALREGRAAIIAGEVTNEALQAMRDLLKPTAPAATRFNAAKWVLEHGQGDADGSDKPLSEMTEAELMAVVAKAKDELGGGLIDVTPKNGA